MVLCTAVFLSGCGVEPEPKKYVARVNDSFLTQNDLDEKLDSSFKNNFYRDEIIRNWIDEELLYQEAVNQGILEEEVFNKILITSERKLAGALLLKNVSDNYEFDYSENNLEEFYQSNPDEFKLRDKSLLLNIAEFKEEDKAIEFRTSVLRNNWENAIGLKKYENTFNKYNNILISINDIYPFSVRNILQQLYPEELSIVINTDTSLYKIFQVVQIFSEGTIPPFNLIKEKVERSFVYSEKQKFIKEFIRKLYSENEIEVKNKDFK